MVELELLDPRDLPDPLETPDPMETLVLPDLLEIPEALERRESAPSTAPSTEESSSRTEPADARNRHNKVFIKAKLGTIFHIREYPMDQKIQTSFVWIFLPDLLRQGPFGGQNTKPG